MRPLLTLLGALAVGTLGLVASAQAQVGGWGPIYDPQRFGAGQGACWEADDNAACLMLTCRNGGPLEIALMAYGGGFGYEPLLPVYIRVDGGQTFLVEMTPLNLFDYQHAAAPYDPALHGDLLAALRTGSTLTVAVYDPNSNPLPYILGNRPDAVDRALASCPPAPVARQPSPVTHPDRFILIDPAAAHPEATQIARSLMTAEMSAEPGTDVMASIAILPDGRQIIVAEHGVSTGLYGITGVGTFVFTAAPGQSFRRAYQTTGAVIWLDIASLSEGFPDIWARNMRGVAVPFGIWRHLGGLYVHQGNTGAP